MLNIDPLYLVINLILLFIFASMGRFVAKGGSYKFSSGVCTIAFTLVLGSRYMRGNDYAHYVDVFNQRTETGQHLFTYLNDFLAAIGIDAYGSFFVYAFIFASCLFYLLRRFKTYATFIFPLALIALIFFHEYMIRQALSFSFIFLFIDQLFRDDTDSNDAIKMEDENSNQHILTYANYISDSSNEIELIPQEENIQAPCITSKSQDKKERIINPQKILLCIVYALAAYSIHSANIFVLIVILLFWLTMREHTIPFYISIPAMLFGALYLNKNLNLEEIAPYINLLQGTDEKLDYYIENSNIWFGDEGISNIYTRNDLILIFELWGNGLLFWMSDKMARQIKLSAIFAVSLNTVIVGNFIMMTFRELEIVHRMGYVLTILWFIPLAICLVLIKDFNFKNWEKVLLIGLVWWLYEYFKYLFLRSEGMTSFLWDVITF